MNETLRELHEEANEAARDALDEYRMEAGERRREAYADDDPDLVGYDAAPAPAIPRGAGRPEGTLEGHWDRVMHSGDDVGDLEPPW